MGTPILPNYSAVVSLSRHTTWVSQHHTTVEGQHRGIGSKRTLLKNYIKALLVYLLTHMKIKTQRTAAVQRGVARFMVVSLMSVLKAHTRRLPCGFPFFFVLEQLVGGWVSVWVGGWG